jgi:hypothetical protein
VFRHTHLTELRSTSTARTSICRPALPEARWGSAATLSAAISQSRQAQQHRSDAARTPRQMHRAACFFGNSRAAHKDIHVFVGWRPLRRTPPSIDPIPTERALHPLTRVIRDTGPERQPRKMVVPDDLRSGRLLCSRASLICRMSVNERQTAVSGTNLRLPGMRVQIYFAHQWQTTSNHEARQHRWEMAAVLA